jgi:hypothetical protein
MSEQMTALSRQALLRPQTLLIAAIALLPLTMSLSGGDPHPRTSVTTAFGPSDVLLLLALPWIIAQTVARREALRLSWGRGFFLPVLLYLAAGVVSFCRNLPAMDGHTLSYFMGFLRNAQIVLILPLAFMALPWREADSRAMLSGYLLVCAAIALGGVVAFAIGIRNGLNIYGMPKNSVGLSLSLGALIAFAALTQPPASKTEIAALTGMPPRGVVAILCLCVLALDCSQARGAFLSFLAGLVCVAWLHRCWRAALLVAAGATLMLFGVLLLLPKESRDYLQDVSEAEPSRYEREYQFDRFRQRLPTHWLLGDGFRARRDYLPHNLEVMLLAENGVVGTALFFWALVAQLRIFRAGRSAFAADPERQWFCAAMLAASVAILVHAQFDPYWRRGPLWLPWAGVGLILALFRANLPKGEDRIGPGGSDDEDAP